jgi:hypothetical protein
MVKNLLTKIVRSMRREYVVLNFPRVMVCFDGSFSGVWLLTSCFVFSLVMWNPIITVKLKHTRYVDL